MQQVCGGAGDLVNGGIESRFVGFRGMLHASDFADELEGSGADFLRSYRRIEIEEGFDVATHGAPLFESWQAELSIPPNRELRAAWEREEGRVRIPNSENWTKERGLGVER